MTCNTGMTGSNGSNSCYDSFDHSKVINTTFINSNGCRTIFYVLPVAEVDSVVHEWLTGRVKKHSAQLPATLRVEVEQLVPVWGCKYMHDAIHLSV